MAIMVRYNLQAGGLGKKMSFFLGVVAPWIVTLFCYEYNELVSRPHAEHRNASTYFCLYRPRYAAGLATSHPDSSISQFPRFFSTAQEKDTLF